MCRASLTQVQLLFGMSAIGAAFLAALGPRPADPEHGWNVYGPDWLFLLIASALMLGQFNENLKAPAQVTAKCDLITDELNLLRTLDGSRLADADTLTRVEALERYIKKIGLGYRLGGFRISVHFVQHAMLNLVTALSILVPMLLVVLERVVVPLEEQQQGTVGWDDAGGSRGGG